MRPEFSAAAFAAAVLNPDAPPPPGLTSHSGRGSVRRFEVYRNNVLSGLTRSLATRFAVCERIVGDEFFRALATEFVRRSPPASAMLMQYGGDFADFIEAFEPAAELPWLGDVARLEFACGRAAHAADAPPLTGADVAAVPQEDWGALRLRLHPAAELLRSRWPVVTIYRMNRPDGEPAPVDFSLAEDALVTRPLFEVDVRALKPGGHEFFAAIECGQTLEDATLAGAAIEGFDASQALVTLLTSGACLSPGDRA